MKTGSVYVIRNINNGKVYVGSAYDVRQRWNLHKQHLRKHQHHSILFQRAWDKYGVKSFTFKVVESDIDANFLLPREQFWIWRLESTDPKKGYNIQKRPGSQAGMKKSAEAVAKTVKANTGRKHTPESVANMTVAQNNRSEEWCENIAEAKRGVPRPEHMREVSRRNGKRSAEEHRKRMRDNPEYKEKILSGLHSPEARAKAAAKNKGQKRSEEVKQKISASKKGKKPHINTLESNKKSGGLHAIRMRDDPEYRKNWLAKIAETYRRKKDEKAKEEARKRQPQQEFDF